MERKSLGPTLMDHCFGQLGDPRMAAKLERLGKAIPWEKLAEPIRRTYANTTAKGGRPNVPVVVMLKVVMLQKGFNLSDPAVEGMLLDRLSFRRFVGLSMLDGNVDETTIVEFRNRLREHGLAGELFDAVVQHLREAGLIVEEGTLVDATIIESPRGGVSDDGLKETRDGCATYTKKNGRTYHGYKGHIATDGHGVVTDYVFDTAKVHDSKHIDQLIKDEKQAVFADSAYMDKARKERLERSGVFCGVIERRVRGQGELSEGQESHNRLCSRFRAFVEHPFAWMKQSGGFRRTRYRGLARNAVDFALGLIAYNLRRSLSLEA